MPGRSNRVVVNSHSGAGTGASDGEVTRSKTPILTILWNNKDRLALGARPVEFTEFKRGCVNLNDEFRDTRPLTVLNNKKIDAVRRIIETDRHVT
ncbi:hypothetical protein EVAR_54184_1 [Eumeta japonica]|uniref:Uncharacterized protein n=1 Tax=Eumeta variegata TaxID=151549 RepID=A0A4C1Z855_EUMVA|nr:hypothetical protein EVAR_54184_1 [Eumeta japonica]